MREINVVDPHTDKPRRVFHVSELEKLGVSQSTSYRRARAGGPWRRLAPGIILTSSDPPRTEDLIAAALLRAGPSAMVTGIHGARLHGLNVSADNAPVHILIPHSRRLQNQPSIVFERTTRLPRPVPREGIPVAPITRAVMDGARTWQTRKLTEELLVKAIQHTERCHPERLVEEMELGSRRGTGLPREILRSITVDVRSLPELKAFRLIRASDLPAPMWNPQVYTPEGRYISCPDMWFDDVGLAVEVDSYDFHFSKTDYAGTLYRNTRYATHGIVVLPILPSRLTTEPEAVLADIKKAYEVAASRQRPQVVARYVKVNK